jgi:hypothetical protein
MMVRASEPSNERECGIHTEKREKEEGERVNIRFLIYSYSTLRGVSREKRQKKRVQ